LKVHSISLYQEKILGINLSDNKNLVCPSIEYILKRLESFGDLNFKLVADYIRSLNEVNHIFSTLSISHLKAFTNILQRGYTLFLENNDNNY
jgi:hypothetical protein